MKRKAFVLGAAVGGATVAAMLGIVSVGRSTEGITAPAASGGNDFGGAPETRTFPPAAVDALNDLLEREIEERIRLQQQVDRLENRLAAFESNASDSVGSGTTRTVQDPPPLADPPAPGGLSEAALVAAGFTEAEAAYFRRRHDEAAMARLYLRDQAQREGWMGTPRYFESLDEIRGGLESLRKEMDEEAYTRYRYALGEPNQVTVQRVLSGSAAEVAGLKPGDVILRYEGDRMFSVSDVRRKTRGGQSGETITVEILRNGQEMQAYLPRGPLGVRMSAESVLPAGDG